MYISIINEEFSYCKLLAKINHTIARYIKIVKKRKKINTNRVCEFLHTTQDSISLWWLGKSYPDIPTLIEIARFFEVTTDYLLGLENWKKRLNQKWLSLFS